MMISLYPPLSQESDTETSSEYSSSEGDEDSEEPITLHDGELYRGSKVVTKADAYEEAVSSLCRKRDPHSFGVRLLLSGRAPLWI